MLFYEIWTLFSLFLLSRRIIQCLLSYLIFLYLSILLMQPAFEASPQVWDSPVTYLLQTECRVCGKYA